MKSMAAIVLLFAAIGVADAGLMDGLALYLPFDGDTQDLSPNGTDGINSGVTWTNDAQGAPGNAAYFDGSGSQVYVSDTPSLDPDYLTLSFWFNLASFDEARELVNKIGSNGDISYGSEIRGNTLYFRISADGTASGITDLAATTAVQVGTWYHFAGTYDGSEMRVYLNGNLEATTPKTGSVFDSSVDLRIGRYDYFSGWVFQGAMDEVALWDRALTESEISQLYVVGIPEPSSAVLTLLCGVAVLSFRTRPRKVKRPVGASGR